VRFFAAAVTVYVVAVSAGVAVYVVFRDSLEDLWENLRWWLAERRRPLCAAAVVAGLAVATAFLATRDLGASKTPPSASIGFPSVPRGVSRLLYPRRSPSARTAMTHAHPSSAQRAARRIARPAEHTAVRHTAVRHPTVVSNLQPVSDRTPVAAVTTASAGGSPAGGPTPLQAPKAGSAPTPLKAP
jgi:hypothetical protein